MLLCVMCVLIGISMQVGWTRFFFLIWCCWNFTAWKTLFGGLLGKKDRNLEELCRRLNHWIGGYPSVLSTRWMNKNLKETMLCCMLLCGSLLDVCSVMKDLWSGVFLFQFDIWVIWVFLLYVLISISLEIDWTHLFLLTWWCWNFSALNPLLWPLSGQETRNFRII